MLVSWCLSSIHKVELTTCELDLKSIVTSEVIMVNFSWNKFSFRRRRGDISFLKEVGDVLRRRIYTLINQAEKNFC